MSRRADALSLASVGAFFRDRWLGDVSLHTLFLRDMLIVGTLINLATTATSLIVLSSNAPAWVGFATFLMPVPYNLFLMISVWRCAERMGGVRGTVLCVLSALWTIGACLI